MLTQALIRISTRKPRERPMRPINQVKGQFSTSLKGLLRSSSPAFAFPFTPLWVSWVSSSLLSWISLKSKSMGLMRFRLFGSFKSSLRADTCPSMTLLMEEYPQSSRGVLMLNKPVEKTTHVSLAPGVIPGSSSSVREIKESGPCRYGVGCFNKPLTERQGGGLTSFRQGVFTTEVASKKSFSTDDYLRSEEAFHITELPRGEFQRRDVLVQWVQQNDRSHGFSFGNNRRRSEHKPFAMIPELHIPYIPPQRPNQEPCRPKAVLTLNSLSSTPQEILATKHQLNFPQPTPLVGVPTKENLNRYCDYHNEKGHNTNDCFHLKQQLEKALESDEKWMKVPITFPPVPARDLSEEALVIEAEVEGYLVRRIHIDAGASIKIMFEHCFNMLHPSVRSRKWAMPTGNYENSTIIPAHSPYNIILGRPGLKKLRALPSTIHGMMKFPAPYTLVELAAYNITYEPRSTIKDQILADFINKIPSAKVSGAGLVLISPTRTEYTYAIRLNFDSTNNQAEYKALLAGLRIAKKMGNPKHTPKPEPEGRHTKQAGLRGFQSPYHRSVSRNIDVPSMDDEEINTVVEEEGETWMTPIINCIERGIWLEDQNEARALRMKIGQYVMEEGVLFKRSYLMPMLRCVSEYVYRKKEASRVENLGKLGPKQEGPFLVVEPYQNGSYKLRTMDDREESAQSHPALYFEGYWDPEANFVDQPLFSLFPFLPLARPPYPANSSLESEPRHNSSKASHKRMSSHQEPIGHWPTLSCIPCNGPLHPYKTREYIGDQSATVSRPQSEARHSLAVG
uniref:Reverse transcriptase domain-containing protein n=1 Tax=Tanacetum cinerariifolium TaxID=118510 RepID=A0A6L2NDQ9_TANCI|nr:reverse transcriptase domain-containing protein [Tanacetum cinerariifolium]